MLVAEDLGDQRGVAYGRRVLERVVESARARGTIRSPPRAAVRRQSGSTVASSSCEQLAEEVVVAIPLAVGVERDEEAVLTLELPEPDGGVRPVEHGVAQRQR